MKKVLFLWLFMNLISPGIAQSCPPEWIQYTGRGYFYDIQSDHNHRGLPETEFKNYLLDIARTNLARQIQTHVTEHASLNKQSIEGHTSVGYASNSQFSTQVNLKLVETNTLYNPSTQEGYAIAYLDKLSGISYYKYELNLCFEKIENSLSIANNYIQSGFKGKAREELEKLNPQFSQAEEALSWLGILGLSAEHATPLLNRTGELKQQVKSRLAELQHSTVICLSCQATLSEKPYPSLQKELKGVLAQEGCSFTTDPTKADWVISITASTREYNSDQAGESSLFFVYADASISIDKQLTTQRIYEDELSTKGGHSLGFTEAGRKAYKNMCNQLSKKILEIIKQ